MRVLRWFLLAAGGLLLLVTLLPLLRAGEWWIRVWDFPRLQIAAALLPVLLLSLRAFGGPGRWWPRGRWPLAFVAALALALGYQTLRVLPYSPLWAKEMLDGACGPETRLRVMVFNVLMTNRRADDVLAEVRRVDPDVLVLLETDAWWDSRLSPLRASYPNALARPLENTYGIHVFSRLEWREAELRTLVEPDIPSARMELRLPGGDRVWFHALHPRPPIPGQDSEPRDAELLLVGQEIAAAPRPSVVMGDLNDVAWSSTSRLFARVAGMLDPRRGRGLYPTFNANWPLLRWPLDHVFATEEFTLADMQVLPSPGSDHFPVKVDLCYRPRAAAAQEPAPLRPGDPERARDRIEEGLREGAAR